MSVDYLDRPFVWKRQPLWWHLKGLIQTASGYGRKLTTDRVIQLEGEKIWRRVYCVCFSNSGSVYVVIKGSVRYIRDYDFSAEPIQ